jgi:hypothetical protein
MRSAKDDTGSNLEVSYVHMLNSHAAMFWNTAAK